MKGVLGWLQVSNALLMLPNAMWSTLRGNRGLKFRASVLIPYLVKHTLLHIVVVYFCKKECFVERFIGTIGNWFQCFIFTATKIMITSFKLYVMGLVMKYILKLYYLWEFFRIFTPEEVFFQQCDSQSI